MYYFGPDYEERARLRDGAEVVLRTVRPDDKALLRDGFHKLSEESRYLRFFSPKLDLSDDELRYLTEVDGVRHFAIGAVRVVDGVEEGLSVARFIQLPDQPGVAEAAIAVLDEMQGKGLGSLLFLRLVAAAQERGVRRIRCELLGSNRGMHDFLLSISPERTVEIDQGVMSIEFALPDVEPAQPPAQPPRESSLYKFFTMVAQGGFDWRGVMARLTLRRRDSDEAPRRARRSSAPPPRSRAETAPG